LRKRPPLEEMASFNRPKRGVSFTHPIFKLLSIVQKTLTFMEAPSSAPKKKKKKRNEQLSARALNYGQPLFPPPHPIHTPSDAETMQ
jgi:hypothetical protein